MTFSPCKKRWFAWALIFAALTGHAADTGRRQLHGHVPAPVDRLVAKGLLAATNELTLAIGLPVRNQSGLGDLIQQLYDPASANFHRFLKRGEFAAQFGATEAEYQAVQDFARSNSFAIIGYHSNRLVLDVQARAADVERAFNITLHTYRHPAENRDFFAPDSDPSVPTSLLIVDIWGLSDYSLPKPLSHPALRRKAQPAAGSGAGGSYAGNDLRNAYAPGSPLTGAGQTVGLFQFSSYSMSNITNYERMIGRTNFVPLTNVILPGGTPRSTDNDETCLDIEMAIAMALQLSQVIVYEIKAVDPVSILNRMADDDLAMQLSSSWSWSGGPSTNVDAAFMQMITQGQSFFQASGDSDAYTGSQALDNVNQTFAPMDSTNITSVGGTTLTMNGAGASWAAEKTWNYNTLGFPNIGSGGGVSLSYTIPSWQTNVNTNLSHGSATFRNIPDVAMLADGVSVVYTSGGVSVTNSLAGTSCAAPMWAGYCALLNQQSVASGSGPVGFLNPAIYQLATQTNYTNCFHDITAGNNIGTNTPGLFSATNGYDLCTGLGSPNGMALINALAPRPAFLHQPASQVAPNGATVTFNATPLGAPPYSFQWLFNNTNLPSGPGVSGVNTNILTLTGVTAGSAGNYSLIFTNPFGVITSSVAALTVGFAPSVSSSPTNQFLLAGSSVTYTASVSGSIPQSYQWQQNGTNLANGTGISGVATATLTLTGITTNRTGVYTIAVTNLFGGITNTIATLTVVLPPSITSSSLTNRTLQCGGNVTNHVTASGTAPLFYQWTFDSVPVPGATNAAFTNLAVHLPNHIIGIVISNLYATITSNIVLTVTDTQPPFVTLNGPAVMTNELFSAFTDPGATASDVCMGVLPVTTNGVVNVNAVGTNTLTYTATDSSGNTTNVTRKVYVLDTEPPVVLHSFTNLFQTLDSNCSALLTNVTGTNFIVATDLVNNVIITQSPTNDAPLQLGTNLVVLTVSDPYGNAVFSTNFVIVSDASLPAITSQPQSQTNSATSTASFNIAATACTPITYQWLFNAVSLTNQNQSVLTLSNLDFTQSGNYSVTVASAGGTVTSSVAVLTVNRLASSLTLFSSDNPDEYLATLNFTALVTPTNATGAVQFLTNNSAFDLEPLAAGSAVSAGISSLGPGANLITAIYSGDPDYLPATNTLNQIVTNRPPQVSAAFSNLSAFSLTINGNLGQPITVQVSTNLTTWDNLFTTNPVTLPFTWTDPSANNFSQRYFKIVQ